MEKLIELLNEHFKEKYKNSKRNLIYFERYDDVNHGFNMNNEDRVYNGFVAEETILGKRYGFIKWLVENDKIDIKKLVVKGEMRSGWDFENKKGDEEEGEEIWNKYYSELCLMLLSISDTPIEDLVSYLK